MKIIKSTIALLLFTCVLFSSMVMAETSQNTLTSQEKALFNQRVKEALINDPEILKAAILALQAHEKQQQAEQKKAGIVSNYDLLFNNPNDPWIGAETPALTIAYFGDFNCGFCKKIEPSLSELIKAYPQIRVVFKFVPILGESSKQAAALALTVWEKDRNNFAALHQRLMANKGRLSTDMILKAGELTGTEKWVSNITASADTTMSSNLALMQQFGLTGTPSLIFADQIIAGLIPYDQLQQRIDSALAAQN